MTPRSTNWLTCADVSSFPYIITIPEVYNTGDINIRYTSEKIMRYTHRIYS